MKKVQVIIAFVEELDDSEEIRDFASQSDAFKFCENKQRDIYQDYLPNPKK